jgi:hypothetical protein
LRYEATIVGKISVKKYYMFSSKIITFCKSANCPASQKLLAFQNGEVSVEERETILRHLAACEFCAAEVEFYARYPQVEEEIVAKAEIPVPLFELASALLGNKHKDFSLLNQLLCQNEGINI